MKNEIRKGDIVRDAEGYVGPVRATPSSRGGRIFMTVKASDTGADIPRLARLPVTLRKRNRSAGTLRIPTGQVESPTSRVR